MEGVTARRLLPLSSSASAAHAHLPLSEATSECHESLNVSYSGDTAEVLPVSHRTSQLVEQKCCAYAELFANYFTHPPSSDASLERKDFLNLMGFGETPKPCQSVGAPLNHDVSNMQTLFAKSLKHLPLRERQDHSHPPPSWYPSIKPLNYLRRAHPTPLSMHVTPFSVLSYNFCLSYFFLAIHTHPGILLKELLRTSSVSRMFFLAIHGHLCLLLVELPKRSSSVREVRS